MEIQQLQGLMDAKISQTLGISQTDFLNLFITQLRYQDPLEPMTNEDFVAQMSRFAMLEELQDMKASLMSLSQQSALSWGTGLLGKCIEYSDDTGGISQGYVEAITSSDGVMKLVVDGKEVGFGQVLRITQAKEG